MKLCRTLPQNERRTPVTSECLYRLSNSGRVSSTAWSNHPSLKKTRCYSICFQSWLLQQKLLRPRATTQIQVMLPKIQFQPEKKVCLEFIPPCWVSFEGYWEAVQGNLLSERANLTTSPTFQPLLKVDCKHMNKYTFPKNDHIQTFTITF